MYCPTCRNRMLRPSKLAPGLPGFSCNSCGGNLIEILSYRMWSEQKPAENVKKNLYPKNSPEDSKQTLVCPKCNKLMTKFLISGTTLNKIDLCGNCGRFWLDGGEWSLLECLDLENDITRIFNEPWQKSIRKDISDKVTEDKYKSLIGEADYSKLINILDWIKNHPKKDEIIAYLCNPAKYSR